MYRQHRIISREQQRIKNEEKRALKNLPIYSKRQEILDHIKQNKFTIIVGDTGCGKSTQLPQYLFEEYEQNVNAKILWILPRKLPTVSLAERVCQEMEMTLGEEIGFELVSDYSFGDKTRLKFVLDSALVRELIKIRENLNPTDKLELDYSVIVLDEVHERNLYTDILLATLKEIALNSDLKLVITSATINEEIFEKYFNTKSIHVEGRPFPVRIEYNPCPESIHRIQHVTDTILDMVRKMTRIDYEYKGHILVFTSGIDDIEKIWFILGNYASLPGYQVLDFKQKFEVLPLHGLLAPEDQKGVFEDFGKIKIILATRMAETAITIEGVRVVIDIGYDKETMYDPTKRMTIIETRNIPQSSAVQRAGRAGRTASGLCIRLYSEEEFETFSKNKISQIQRMDLGKVALELKAMGVPDVTNFDFIEKPSQENLIQTIEHLKDLDALDYQNGNLTDIGKAMLKLDTDPTFSKVIIEGLRRNCEQEVIKIIALIGVAGNLHYRGWDDATKEQADKKKLKFCHKSGDLITLLKIYEITETLYDNEQPRWFRENFLNFNAFKGAKKTIFELQKGLPIVKQILKINPTKLPPKFKKSEEFYESIIKCFLRAFYQNVCHYSGNPRLGYWLLRTDIALKIYGSSSLALLQENPEYMICLDVNRNKYNHTKIVSAINKKWIQELFPNHSKSMNLSYLSKTYNFEEFVEPRITKSALAFFSYKMTPEIKEVAESFNATFYPAFIEEKLYVFTHKSNKEELRTKVKGLLEYIRSKFESETREIDLVLKTRGVFKSGGEIKEILLDKETRSIAFDGFDPTWNQNTLTKAFTKIAKVDSISIEVDQISKLLRGIIKMETSQGAEELLKHYEKEGLDDFEVGLSDYQPTLTPFYYSSGYGAGRALRVKIEWYTGVSNRSAKLGFQNRPACELALSKIETITQSNDFKRLFARDVEEDEEEYLRKALKKEVKIMLKEIMQDEYESEDEKEDEEEDEEDDPDIRKARAVAEEKAREILGMQIISEEDDQEALIKTLKRMLERLEESEEKLQNTRRPTFRNAINKTNIIFENLNPYVDEYDIKNVLKKYNIAQDLKFVFLFRLDEPHRNEDVPPEIYIDIIREELRTKVGIDLSKTLRLEPCAPKKPVYNERTDQMIKDYKRRVEVDVVEFAVAKKIIEYFDNKVLKTLTNGRLHCKVDFTKRRDLICKRYKVVEQELENALMQKKQEKGYALTIIEYNRKYLYIPASENKEVGFRMIADDPQTLNECTSKIDPIVHGSSFYLKTSAQMKKLDQKASDIIRIKLSHCVEIDIDTYRRKITVFGAIRDREAALKDIEAIFASKEDQDLCEVEISFKHEPINNLLTKDGRLRIPLEKMYDVNYQVSLVTRQIKIFGYDEANVEEAAKEVRKLLGSGLSESEINERKCPICREEINDGYRLQLCGHRFCFTCIEADLDERLQNNPKFPLLCPKCVEENEQTNICIRDLGNILRGDMYRSLWYKSLESYLSKNPEKYFRCFSPNCPQIFRSSSEKNFSCDYCLKEYCKKCGRKPHGEEICEDDEKKKLLENLIKQGKQVKECPRQDCKHIIEKNGGCNKIQCTKCFTVFCWICCQIFGTYDQFYTHYSEIHGGMIDDLEPQNAEELNDT